MASSNSDALAALLGPWSAAGLETLEEDSDEEPMELHVSQDAEAAAGQTSLALSNSSHAGLAVTMPSTHPSLPPSSLSGLESLMTEALTRVAGLEGWQPRSHRSRRSPHCRALWPRCTPITWEQSCYGAGGRCELSQGWNPCLLY